MALPIWGIYMKKVYEDKKLNVSKSDFERPAVLDVDIDCSKFKTTQDNSLNGGSENFDNL
jgi:penicillin-binding protein 1A